MRNFSSLILLLLSITSCSLKAPKEKWELSTFRPEFEEERAYNHIENQLNFGYRIPQSSAHKKCRNYIKQNFKTKGYLVSEKEGLKQTNKGLTHIFNITAKYKPKEKSRILLATSYDSRNVSLTDNNPILAANSGASGVAVLLEIARLIKQDSLNIGVDFVFFDAKDQGNEIQPKTFNVGAQSWVENTTTEYKYGIVLDMVAAKNATFVKEEFSGYFCKDLQNELWDIANKLNFKEYFPPDNIANLLVNDHYYINNHSRGKIPTLILTDYKTKDKSYFKNWHTHKDNVENIDKKTLKVVGQTLIEHLYLKRK